MSHQHDTIPEALPFLPLRTGAVLPGVPTTIPVGRPRSKALAQAARVGDTIAIGVQLDPDVEEPTLSDVHEVAVLARVKNVVDRGRRGMLISVDVLGRFRPTDLVEEEPFWKVRGLPLEEVNGDTTVTRELAEALRKHVIELAGDDRNVRDLLTQTTSAGLLADRIAGWLQGEDEPKVKVLLELDVEARLRRVTDLLVEVKGLAELRSRLESEVRREMTRSQREAMLRQQLRAIQRELGEDEGEPADELRARFESKDLPPEVRRAVERELRRLDSLGPQQAESHVIRTYVEWLLDLPWNERADTGYDIDAIARVLEQDHYGIEDVKKRILEHMAVLKLTGRRRGTIVCLAGPPGVGKTSLAQSVATAIGRPLVRISLGGVRDEAEIRGHRRTYVGSLPGRIVHALRKAQVKNPVVVLDEVDKLGRSWAGDPEAALLEVLDPEQNKHFVDHYLELPFDLSEVMFIATANDIGNLSPPLRDRLEIIELTGYTTEEKREIARRHLVRDQMEEHGLPADSVHITDEALDAIVRDYTRESGVRQLKRSIEKICRAIALDVARAQEKDGAPVAVEADDLRRLLGKQKYFSEIAERHAGPGVAAGLAWTPVGGDILYIETTRMQGSGKIEITGQLGDVMQESARAALAYLRSRADDIGVDAGFLKTHDVHIHVPAGAVPKDGPSAGVTIFTALASLLTARPIRSDTAMTGEATLRGRVLPVGGIKSKVLAAHRAGFKRVILPKRNEGDLDEVPESARQDLEFIFAEDMQDVLNAALEEIAGSEGEPTPSGGARRGEDVSPLVAA